MQLNSAAWHSSCNIPEVQQALYGDTAVKVHTNAGESKDGHQTSGSGF